ncbi:phosphomethylpyrimidine synthase ThiC [Candidatus Sumerlaeota bacterium]|nr:phosphomethylpyrimidine synthase ThiC [Candidatus Sumerlaeota bacterium]
MTQLESAKKGVITREMQEVAEKEHIRAEDLRELIAQGRVVIPKNVRHSIKPIGIGERLRTKVNANIGTSPDYCNLVEELKKLDAAVDAGTDTIMDLSTGGTLDIIRKKIIEASPVPVGSVPIYQVAVELLRQGKRIEDMTEEHILDVIRRHAEDGIDFITIHCGVTRRALAKIERKSRIMDVVSRGGAFIIRWMRANGKENPFYTAYDKIIEIAREYDVTFSLGDGLRPGCIHDATDSVQIDELVIISELRDRAVEAGVQVMVEGPGHVPLSEIEANVLIEKKVCKGAPFYLLGPLATDVAPGYDHIVAAIGGALAAKAGADFLCYVTPAEHLRLPTVEDVRLGVIGARIAAHIGDMEKGYPGAREWDDKLSRAREARDWESMFQLALDPIRPRQYRTERAPKSTDVCTMCGELCSMKAAQPKEQIKILDELL